MRNRLAEERENKGLSKAETAKAIGCGLRMYQRMEEGTRTGRPEWWDKLEDLLGVPQRELRENSDAPASSPCPQANLST